MSNYTFQKSFKKQRSLWEQINYCFKKIPFVWNINFTKEIQLISLFSILFLILIIRLFYLQIIQHDKYEAELTSQSTSLASVSADRWDIYAVDKTWQPVKLTENIDLYDIAIDPREIWEDKYKNSLKPRFIELITPITYKHLCEIHWMEKIDTATIEWKEKCIKNIEAFADIELLPKTPDFFYYWAELDAEWNKVPIISQEYNTFDFNTYEERKLKVIEDFSKDRALQIIQDKLNEKIKIWIREKNYVWYYTNEEFLQALEKQNFNFISIEAKFYLYVVPTKSTSSSDKKIFQNFMNKRWIKLDSSRIEILFKQQEYRYVKLFSSANPQVAQEIKQLKRQTQKDVETQKALVNQLKDKVNQGKASQWELDNEKEKYTSIYEDYSLARQIILESNTTRYYPYDSFMANILWYVDKNWDAYYGIEKYYDNILKWTDWKITWRSSRNMGWNDFEVIDAKDWNDIILTIDFWIQKEIESITNKYLEMFNADSIAIMVFDPNKWEVKASASFPTYNPNNYNDAYTIVPLGPELSYIIDNETYNEVPVYIYTWWKYIKATSTERTDTSLKKYIAKNIYWAQVFIDKNISAAFEPGSIFKSFTMAIGLDSDEVRLDDYYQDDWSLKIDIYTIQDADKAACMWYHTLQEALINSCNVWMIRIVQALGKEIFYNYLIKLGFWESTWIELAEEKSWSLPRTTTVSMATFFNNSFGQWLTVTQIQLAAAYSALVNWGKYIQPTIISQIREKTENSNEFSIQKKSEPTTKQIFRPEVSDEMRNALLSVVETNDEYKYAKVKWYHLWAKSGTSQIAYKWKYQRWEWWTQATFAWVVSIDNPQYIILIWVSRPRTNQWWVSTAGKIFNEIATFLIGYSMIE